MCALASLQENKKKFSPSPVRAQPNPTTATKKPTTCRAFLTQKVVFHGRRTFPRPLLFTSGHTKQQKIKNMLHCYYYYYYCLGHSSSDFFFFFFSCQLRQLHSPFESSGTTHKLFSFPRLKTTAITCRKHVVLAKRFKTLLLCCCNLRSTGGHCITASFDDALHDGTGGQIARAILRPGLKDKGNWTTGGPIRCSDPKSWSTMHAEQQ